MKFKMIDKKDNYEAPSYKLFIFSDEEHVEFSYRLLANNDEEAIKATENWIKETWVKRSFVDCKKCFDTYKVTAVILTAPDGRTVMEAEESLLKAMNKEPYFCSENFDYDEKTLEQLRRSREFQKAVYHNVLFEAKEDFRRFSFCELLMNEKLLRE